MVKLLLNVVKTCLKCGYHVYFMTCPTHVVNHVVKGERETMLSWEMLLTTPEFVRIALPILFSC